MSQNLPTEVSVEYLKKIASTVVGNDLLSSISRDVAHITMLTERDQQQKVGLDEYLISVISLVRTVLGESPYKTATIIKQIECERLDQSLSQVQSYDAKTTGIVERIKKNVDEIRKTIKNTPHKRELEGKSVREMIVLLDGKIPTYGVVSQIATEISEIQNEEERDSLRIYLLSSQILTKFYLTQTQVDTLFTKLFQWKKGKRLTPVEREHLDRFRKIEKIARVINGPYTGILDEIIRYYFKEGDSRGGNWSRINVMTRVPVNPTSRRG